MSASSRAYLEQQENRPDEEKEQEREQEDQEIDEAWQEVQYEMAEEAKLEQEQELKENKKYDVGFDYFALACDLNRIAQAESKTKVEVLEEYLKTLRDKEQEK